MIGISGNTLRPLTDQLIKHTKVRVPSAHKNNKIEFESLLSLMICIANNIKNIPAIANKTYCNINSILKYTSFANFG